MGNIFYFSFEPTLMQWIQEMVGQTGARVLSQISALGEEAVMVLVLGFLYWCYDKEFGIFVGTNASIAIVMNPLIKNIALRVRPYMVHEGIKCIRPVDPSGDIYDITVQGYSFPSGHSMNSAVVYGSLARYGKKKILTVLGFILPLLIGFSRVTAGVHYPTDVLTGWAVGAAVIFLFPYIYEKFGRQKRWILNLIIFLISSLGLFYCRTTEYFTGLGIMGGFFAGIEFEERFVKFESTKKPGIMALRLIGGLAIFAVLNTLIKLPFSEEFLNSATMSAFVLRFVRYMVVLFLLIGVYPYTFGLFSGKKKPE